MEIWLASGRLKNKPARWKQSNCRSRASALVAEFPGRENEEPNMKPRERILIFAIGGKSCALPLGVAREVLPMAALSRPPGLPSIMEGFLDLGGRAVPVLRLDQLLGLPAWSPGVSALLLLADLGKRLVAFPVSNVEDVVSVGADFQFLPLAEAEAFNGCVRGLLHQGGQTHCLLDPERLLLAAEARRVAEFREREQERLSALEPMQLSTL